MKGQIIVILNQREYQNFEADMEEWKSRLVVQVPTMSQANGGTAHFGQYNLPVIRIQEGENEKGLYVKLYCEVPERYIDDEGKLRIETKIQS